MYNFPSKIKILDYNSGLGNSRKWIGEILELISIDNSGAIFKQGKKTIIIYPDTLKTMKYKIIP